MNGEVTHRPLDHQPGPHLTGQHVHGPHRNTRRNLPDTAISSNRQSND